MYRLVLDFQCERPERWLFVNYDDILAGDAVPRLEAHLDAEADANFVKPCLDRSGAADVELPTDTRRIYDELLSRA